jgi:hypothetical protein
MLSKRSSAIRREPVDDVIEEARRLKSRAMDARDEEDFERAERLIEKAEAALKAELKRLKLSRKAADVQDRPARRGTSEVKVAEQLGHVLGTKGGIYRRWKKYEDSARAYDEGYQYEKVALDHGTANSYDLVQRLVARAFVNPSALRDDTEVLGLPLRRALFEARGEVDRQLAGDRANDEYAAADLALIWLLQGDAGWEAVLDRFVFIPPPDDPSKTRPSLYAIEVTLDVVNRLRGALKDKPDTPVDLAERLTLASVKLENCVRRLKASSA